MFLSEYVQSWGFHWRPGACGIHVKRDHGNKPDRCTNKWGRCTEARVLLQVLECSVFIGMAVGDNCPGHRLVGKHTEYGGDILGERTMVTW